MRKQTLVISALLNIALASSALAAKDDVLLQITRKNQLAYDAAQSAQPAAPANKLVLPLDHGPRAVVTPWVNQQRRLKAAEAEKAKAAAPGS